MLPPGLTSGDEGDTVGREEASVSEVSAEISGAIDTLKRWSDQQPSAAEVAYVRDALGEVTRRVRALANAPHRDRTQIRTSFTPAEIRRINGTRGLVKASTWVRQRTVDVIQGTLDPVGSAPQSTDTPTERVTFWLEDDLVQQLDQLRGALTRSGWVREKCVRSLTAG